MADTRTRIESEIEVQAYLQDLRYKKKKEARIHEDMSVLHGRT